MQCDNALAAAFGLRKLDVHLLFRAFRGLYQFHALDLLELALRLGCLGGLGTEAVHETLQGRDLLLLIAVGRPLLGFPFGTLAAVVIIIAPVALKTAVAYLHDAAAAFTAQKRVQKGAVMRDHKDSAGIAPQIILEPDQRLKIQVICRFIQNEQIRLHHQQPRDMGTHDPAAAEGAHRFEKIALPKGQSFQYLRGLGFHFITAQFFISGAGGTVFL